jgi:tetratricopeptide (TPR) repeat protein
VPGEPRPPCRLAWLLGLTVLALAPSSATAQPVDPYVAAVEQYAAGDEDGALNRLAADSGRISSAIVARMRTSTDRQVRSAIMLHTELAAVWLANGRAPQATLQINNARRLLSILTEDTRRRAASEAFAIRWYAFTTSVHTAQGLFVAAFGIIRDGQSVFPKAAELCVARGAIYEMRGTLAYSTRPFKGERLTNDMRRSFEAAAAEYERALSLDASLASAYLHRGWVRYQVGDNRAGEDLESALRAATDDNIRYLAHLFLGALAERNDDLETARGQFEAAHRLGPFQTSAVALGRAEAALGHADRARAITAAYAQLPDRVEDPWWNYQLGGFEPGAITWLRAEARRR